MRISGLYVGFMVAAGLCLPVVAQDGFDFGRFGGDTEGGIQSRGVKTTSYVTTGSTANNDKASMQALSDFIRNKNSLGTKDTYGLTDPNYDPGITAGISDGFESPTGSSGDLMDKFTDKGIQKDTIGTGKDTSLQDNLTEKRDAWKNQEKEREAAENAAKEKERTAAQKRAEKCKQADVQADSKSLAGDTEAIKAELADGGLPTDDRCVAAGKAAMEACAKGDVAGTMSAWDKAADECKKKIQVETPTPVGTEIAADVNPVLEGKVNPLDKVKESLNKFLNLDASGQANPMQQMMMSVLMQKVQEMMSGGAGGGGDGDTGVVTPTKPGPVCDKVTKTDSKKIETYYDFQTGVKIDKPKDVSDTTTTSGTAVTGGSDDDDDVDDNMAKGIVKVVTVITSDACENGNMRLKTVETKMYPNGAIEVNESEDIITD